MQKAELELSDDTIFERKEFIESIKNEYEYIEQQHMLSSEKTHLKTLIDKYEQIQSTLSEKQARLNNFPNEYKQRYQQLHSNLESAEKELYLAESKRSEAQSKYEELKYKASEDEQKGLQQEKINQENYEYDIHNGKFELMKLNSRLSEINNELNHIWVTRSPIDGFISLIEIQYQYKGQFLIKVTIKPD
ncbi:MAG: hypothetical protein HC908_15940 [Calothrix sp. SM1_7_51]|nr:hypothetical protein [Calothrix sp. SM1_7_51]